MPPLAATVSGLADVSQQSRRRHRGDRPLCPADDLIPNSVLSCHCASRTTTLGVVWRDGKPNRGVDLAQVTEAFPWDQAPRYLIRDRDTSYGRVFLQRIRAMGIRDHPIAPRSPWQNACVERLIGSIRRECLDHMIVFGEAHLRRISRGYAAYYNVSRTHRSLNKDAPLHRAIERLGAVISRPVLGGLHHQYCRI